MPQGTAIITGAPRRIGRALAMAAAGSGYDILIHHRHAEADAETLVFEVETLGVRAATLAANLADPTSPAAIIAAAQRLGPVTLLVNNASLFEEDSLEDLTGASWDEHMAVNLRAPVMLTQAMARALPANLQGLVVNILDQRVLNPGPDFFSYTLAKTALWTATQMAAKALAPRIRVNAIGPGPTLASIHQTPADFAAEAASTPLARAVEPEDIAGALRYLIWAPNVTGQMIAVDAGQHLGS